MSEANVIEAMLLRWGESHSSGRTVTLQLPEEDGPHPFKGLKCGPSNGQRLAVSIALIGDDETQSEPASEPAKSHTPFEELKRSNQAFFVCQQPAFYRFLQEQRDIKFSKAIGREGQAATAVRNLCNINTRSAFDTNKEAAAKWDTLFSEYVAWSRT